MLSLYPIRQHCFILSIKDVWSQNMSEFKYVTDTMVDIKHYKNFHDFVRRLLSSRAAGIKWRWWCSWFFTSVPGIKPVRLTWEWHIHVSMEHLNQLGCLWPWSCTHVQDLHRIACKLTLENNIFLWKTDIFPSHGGKVLQGRTWEKKNKNTKCIQHWQTF